MFVAWDLGNAIRSTFLEKYSSKPLGAIIQIRAFPSATPTMPNIIFACTVGDEEATSADNATWANGKAAVVARYGKASFRVGRE